MMHWMTSFKSHFTRTSRSIWITHSGTRLACISILYNWSSLHILLCHWIIFALLGISHEYGIFLWHIEYYWYPGNHTIFHWHFTCSTRNGFIWNKCIRKFGAFENLQKRYMIQNTATIHWFLCFEFSEFSEFAAYWSCWDTIFHFLPWLKHLNMLVLILPMLMYSYSVRVLLILKSELDTGF